MCISGKTFKRKPSEHEELIKEAVALWETLHGYETWPDEFIELRAQVKNVKTKALYEKIRAEELREYRSYDIPFIRSASKEEVKNVLDPMEDKAIRNELAKAQNLKEDKLAKKLLNQLSGLRNIIKMQETKGKTIISTPQAKKI